MLSLEQVKARASTQQRVMIRPKVDVKVTNQAERQQVVQVARKVIAEHREVLTALKDR
ncbi:hypothetical protein J7E62_27840 [Variovorax paradoxus]|nr:hypothetical protein [Variovorax paradoxus]